MKKAVDMDDELPNMDDPKNVWRGEVVRWESGLAVRIDADPDLLNQLGLDPSNPEKFINIRWEESDDEAETATNGGVRLSYFDECNKIISKRWIMKGLFARGETSSWVGPPGAGKSALLTCAAVYVAANQDWRGFRSKEKCGVLYLAFERGDLVKRRLAAYAKQGFEKLPIAIGDQIVDLMNPGAVEIILTTIREASARLNIAIGLIIIDTYAKGIAAGGGDEDKAKDQSRCLAHLRQVQEATGAHIAIIGHTGKDESRGGRGSNAHQADTDVQVQISNDGPIKTASVIKANDQPDGVLLQFTIRSEVMGRDEDDDEISVSILSDDEITVAPKVKAWPKSLTQLFDAITTAVIDDGFDHKIPNGPTVRAVLLEKVRAVYRRNYVVGPDSKSPEEAVNKALTRALKTARDARLIGGDPGAGKQIVWLVKAT